MNTTERSLLQTILSCPTAPFHEHRVRAAVERAAKSLGLPARRDRFGNVYVSYRRGRARPLALSAHMDHPGFEVVDAGPPFVARLLGGVAADMLLDAPVVFHTPGEQPARRKGALGVRGRIARVLPVGPKPPGARRAEVRVEIDAAGPVAADAFGHFDFPGCDFRGDLLHSKALDNVLSCVLILATLARLRRRRVAANVLGVFTRAEEVGFVGAGGVLRSHFLAPSRPLVVLECSKARGDVVIGGGPVLRVGDRMTAFDPEMDLWLSDRAAVLAKTATEFRYQRALMTGGACEASLYMLHGRKTGAIAIPLGNYHNMTDDGRIGAEFIHVRDFDDALRLLEDLCSNPPSASVVRARRAELDRVFADARARLGD